MPIGYQFKRFCCTARLRFPLEQMRMRPIPGQSWGTQYEEEKIRGGPARSRPNFLRTRSPRGTPSPVAAVAIHFRGT
jgi:hypothetical protein